MIFKGRCFGLFYNIKKYSTVVLYFLFVTLVVCLPITTASGEELVEGATSVLGGQGSRISLDIIDADEEERPSNRFEEIMKRFYIGFTYDGAFEHEHDFSFANGKSFLDAAGEGKLGGTHVVRSREWLTRITAISTGQYFVTTDPEAQPGQYVRTASGTRISSAYSALSGVEPNPGESAHVKDVMAYNIDEDGYYYNYKSHIKNDDGKVRIENSTRDSNLSVEADGYAVINESTKVDAGGEKTGWWDVFD